jgi:hypothetical protein
MTSALLVLQVSKSPSHVRCVAGLYKGVKHLTVRGSKPRLKGDGCHRYLSPVLTSYRVSGARMRTDHETAMISETVILRCIDSCLETSGFYASKGNRPLADWWDNRAKVFAHRLETKC